MRPNEHFTIEREASKNSMRPEGHFTTQLEIILIQLKLMKSLDFSFCYYTWQFEY